MQYRVLGRTGMKASVWAFGGIVVTNMPQPEANDIVAKAVDCGVNYFDVAPSYGNAQFVLGPALQPYRKHTYLACKSGKRTASGLREEMEVSLKALCTDYFDTYQLHGLDNPEEIKTALGPDGALSAMVKAKEEGLVRNIGFSCHHQEAALALMEAFDFDSVLFPINWAYWLNGHAGEKVLEMAASRNMARLAMKGLADRPWHEQETHEIANCWYKPIYDDMELAKLALLFTLSQDVHLAISPGDKRMFDIGLRIVEELPDLSFTPELRQALQERARRAQDLPLLFPMAGK